MKIDIKDVWGDFPGGSVVKNLSANPGDMGSIPCREDPTYLGTAKSVCLTTEACGPNSSSSAAAREAPAMRSLSSVTREYDPARCN